MNILWYVSSVYMYIYDDILVGGFNPFEKYDRQNGFIFPKVRGEHKKIFETTTQYIYVYSIYIYFQEISNRTHCIVCPNIPSYSWLFAHVFWWFHSAQLSRILLISDTLGIQS